VDFGDFHKHLYSLSVLADHTALGLFSIYRPRTGNEDIIAARRTPEFLLDPTRAFGKMQADQKLIPYARSVKN